MDNVYAVIENGVVVNVIRYDGVAKLLLPEGQTLQPIGDSGVLTASDVGALAAADAVPPSFTINGKPMTGTGLVVSAGGDGYTKGEVDAKLADYLPILNDYGLGITPHVLSSGSIAENVDGSGFFSYEAGTGLDDQGQTIVTKVSDRPTGSEKGRLIVLSNPPVFDSNGNVTTPAVQDAIGLPEDIEGVFYRRGTGPWTKVIVSADLVDYIKKNSTGLIDTPIVMANNVAIRGEVTPGGGWKDILNMTPTGAVEVGSGSASLSLYSSNDPSVEIGGVDYKIYTEHFPPPASSSNLLKVSMIVNSSTFTKQAGTKKIIAEVVGGGGSGGSTAANGAGPAAGSGGAAGSYCRVLIDMTSVSTISVTIGAGGAGATGGLTTLGGYVTCAGGSAGSTVANANTTTAYADSQNSNYSAVAVLSSPPSTMTVLHYDVGESGGPGVAYMATARSGRGGGNRFGPGGRPVTGTSVGAIGTSPGVGGSGASAIAGAAAQAGGRGLSGAVLIWEYA